MKPPVRVLSVANDVAFGGDEHRLLAFASHIDRRRFDHHVAVIKRSDPRIDERYGSLRPEYRARNITLDDLDVERPGDGVGRALGRRLPRSTVAFARALARLTRIVRERKIDVIDGHIGTGNQAAIATAKATGRPVAITTYHGELFTPHWLWYPIQQATLRAADAIVTDSHQRADAMRRFVGRPALPIEIIPNGIAAEPPRRSAADVRAELGMPNERDALVVGQIAGLVPTKGWSVLLDAAAAVVAAEPHAFFLCIGFDRYDATFRETLRAQAVRLGISDRVRIASYPGHNADVWQLFDVHAHASLFDSLPNAIVEGMAYAKPAVVTDVGDCARTVADGESGYVVPPGDAPRLAARILALLRDPDLRRRFGDEARRRYEAHHRPEAMTGALEMLFERMACERKRS